MFAHRVQHSPQIADADTVQLQLTNGHTTRGCEADDLGKVIAPSEVFTPVHLSRIEKWNSLTAQTIDGLGLGEFVIIASLAGESEVVGVVAASVHPRRDVLNGVCLRGEFLWTAAVFTTAAGVLANEFFRFLPNRHTSRSSVDQVTNSEPLHHLVERQPARLG